MHQAFIASTTLKPMAQQLLQNRTAAAYSGVEAFARKHGGEDAGSLAWLAVGYAHFLDHDYGKAIEPLNRARPHAGDIGDYVAYYLAASYLQSGRSAEGMASLGTFDKTFPGSLLIRDGHVLYANAMLTDNRPKEAVALLESDRSGLISNSFSDAPTPQPAIQQKPSLYSGISISLCRSALRQAPPKVSCRSWPQRREYLRPALAIARTVPTCWLAQNGMRKRWICIVVC
jgi:hypothetical protein